MDRREFLQMTGVAAAGFGLAACSGKVDSDEESGGRGEEEEIAAEAADDLGNLPEIKWEMPTSWPLNLDTIFGGAKVFADEVGKLTAGRFRITANEGGKLVPGLEVLQNVESGAYPIGHTASYYYTGKAEFTAFGDVRALRAQLPAAERLALRGRRARRCCRSFYADRFGVIQFPAGNTGCQMGGWFNKELKSVTGPPRPEDAHPRPGRAGDGQAGRGRAADRRRRDLPGAPDRAPSTPPSGSAPTTT